MKCRNCGVDLVRGFTFCMECGLPVPPEALEESGLPQRNIDSGVQETFGSENGGAPSAGEEREKSASNVRPDVHEEEITELEPVLHGGSDFSQGEALRPELKGGADYTQGEALKPELRGGSSDEDNGAALKAQYVGGIPDEGSDKGADVQAVMREGSADDSDTAVEKLVFCPNCGMHMQKNPTKCEMCGMALGNMPTSSVPKTSSGIPLFNTESDSFGGFGGLGDFGGITTEEAERIDSFMNPDPLFGNGIPTINAQATPDDFAQLTEQLASFSAAPTLDVTQSTVVRQQSTKQGEDFRLTDFQLTDDLSDVVIPIFDNKVHVVEDFSMEEDPDNPLPDPFAFLQTSLDDSAMMPAAEPVQEPVPVSEPQTSPFIEEAPPVITETPASKQPALTDIGEPTKPEAPKLEAIKPEAPKLEAIKPEAPKLEAIKPEVPKLEAIKPEAPKLEAIKPEQIKPEVPKAPAALTAPGAPEAPQHAPKIPPDMKMCVACGRQVPVGDKFCPNCGRSMNPSDNKPAPKKKPVALIVVLVIVLIAAAAFFFLNRDGAFACELPANGIAETFYLTE